MKVWGFTIVKNAVKYDYPVLESIRSILPVCDKFLVLHGDSDDDTSTLLSQINSDKIKIVDSKWDPNLREGGHILANETNRAFNLIPKDVDWCFYIQADEVLHEKYVDIIQKALNEYRERSDVKGFLFKYRHFYGSYDYVGKNSNWYTKEIRIIRNDKAIYSYQDAQGFRIKDNKKLPCILLDAYVYHYGWVKAPITMQKKVKDFHKLWHDDEWVNQKMGSSKEYSFEKIDVLEKFTDSHPEVMNERIKNKNWEFEYDLSQNKYTLKDRLKRLVKRITGRTLGEYRNYKIIN